MRSTNLEASSLNSLAKKCALGRTLQYWQQEDSEPDKARRPVKGNLEEMPHISDSRDFPDGSVVKNPPTTQETQVRSLGQEDSLEKGMTTHSNILASEIPQTEEPGRLQSVGSQKSQM